jgi:ATP-dependent RNA helicase HelY
MNEPRRYASRPRKPYRKSYKPKPRRIVLRPGADQRLKKIFTRIGAPGPKPFEPDPFQCDALEAVAMSDVLVTAPTGAGKTWIALQAIEKIFRKGGRAWYASPLKALTNAKKEEFGVHFGTSNVGILTGDRKENTNAPIIVGTTEILRNQLYDAMHQGIALATDFVVLDEAHFLGDTERGVVWEEIMIYLPQRIPLLMLSATVGNAHEIANWLIFIRDKPCRVIQEHTRPVPLYPMLLHPSGTLYPLLVKKGSQGKNRLYKKVVNFLNTRHRQALAPPGQLPSFGDILQILRKYRLLPAIFFLKSRADCDRAIQLCQENQIVDPQRVDQLNRRIHELVAHQPHIKRHRQRWALEHLAVGSHHSGQLPAWKLVLETLMSEGLLDAIFATSTVAAGVDFPARTVGFLNSDRFNGREFMPLDATELQQMTGRAGRRGKDKVGFAMVVPGKYMDVRQVARLFNAPSAPVHSQIRINFSMTLNLLLSHSPSEIKDLLNKSLAAFQQQGAQIDGEGTAHRHLWKDFERHLAFLMETGFVDNQNRLTEDGLWASHLRIDQPLLVAEGLRQDLFPQNDPAMLAAIMASFVNEKETDEHLDNKRLPKKLTQAVKRVSRGLKGFSKYMQVCRFEVRPLYYRPAHYMWTWASGHSWRKVIETGRMAEGDMAMLVLRTADHLRHLKSLHQVFGPMAAAAKEAIDLILRDPVMPERLPKTQPRKPEHKISLT